MRLDPKTVKDLERAGAISRKAEAPKPDPLSAALSGISLQQKVAMETMRQIAQLLSERREVRYDVIRGENDLISHVVARPL